MNLLTAATVGYAIAHDNELRQVLIERAEAVVNPGADRGKIAVEFVTSGMELQLRAVVNVVREHRPNDGQFIDTAADMGPPIAYFDAAFAPLAVADLKWI